VLVFVKLNSDVSKRLIFIHDVLISSAWMIYPRICCILIKHYLLKYVTFIWAFVILKAVVSVCVFGPCCPARSFCLCTVPFDYFHILTLIEEINKYWLIDWSIYWLIDWMKEWLKIIIVSYCLCVFLWFSQLQSMCWLWLMQYKLENHTQFVDIPFRVLWGGLARKQLDNPQDIQSK